MEYHSGYEELPEGAVLRDGDEYWHALGRGWIKQFGHTGRDINQPDLRAYRWRRKSATPPESIHFL